MNEKILFVCKLLLTLLLAIASPLSAENLRKRSDKMPCVGILGTCFDCFHYCCFPPWHPPEDLKEQMYTPPRAWSAKHLVSQGGKSHGGDEWQQAWLRYVCSWLSQRSSLLAWQRGNSVSFIVRKTHLRIMVYLFIYQPLNPGQFLNLCNSCNLGSLLLN